MVYDDYKTLCVNYSCDSKHVDFKTGHVGDNEWHVINNLLLEW